jgi:hypothetical protein
MKVKHVDHEGSYMRIKHVRGRFAKMKMKHVNQQEEDLKKKKDRISSFKNWSRTCKGKKVRYRKKAA